MAITQGKWWYDERSEEVGSESGWVCSLSRRERKGDQEFGDVVDDGNAIAAVPEMLEVLEELANLMDDIVDGCSYIPDSFTTQPARLIIQRVKGKPDAQTGILQQGE